MFIKNSDRIALIKDDKTIDYNELIKNIKKYSSFLSFGDKNHALILSENRPEWIYSFFACWDKGYIPIVIDVNSGIEEIKYVIKDSNPKIVFTSNEAIKKIEEANEDSIIANIYNMDNINIEDINIEDNNNLNEPSGDDTAVMLYTSGTTGNPKGVMLTYNNLEAEVEGFKVLKLVTEKDQTLALLPFHHILPLITTIFAVISNNASLVFVEKIASKEILEALEKNKVTIIIGVPRLYKLFYDGIKTQIENNKIANKLYNLTDNVITSQKIRRKIFKKIHDKFGGHAKILVSGGAKLDSEIGEFFTRVGFNIIEGYGLTETSPVLAVGTPEHNKVGTVGKAFVNTELKIVDGELWGKGPQIMKGYYNKPEQTKEMITEDGWIKTGDLAEIDSDGYVTILGRKNNMIVLSNGKNIDPEEIEKKLLSMSKGLISEIGVFGRDDRLTAIVVPNLLELRKQGINNINQVVEELIQDYNVEALNYKKILDLKMTDDELPKTRLGKLRRFMLPEMFEKEKEEREKIEEPESEVYSRLKTYITNLKGFEVLANDHFELDAGLDSLDKVELQAFVENVFGVKIDEDILAENHNTKMLSEYIEGKSNQILNNDVNWHEIIENVEVKEIKKGKLMNLVKLPILILLKLYFRLKVVGKNKIQKGPQIFVANHQSFLDALIVASALPKKEYENTYFLAVDLYYDKGIMKYIADNTNIILIDINKNVKDSIEEIANILKQGKNVVIFPEGMRTKDGEVGKFKKVFAILAKEMNIDVQCLKIEGAYEAWSRYMKYPKPKKITVSVLDRFTPEGTYESIVEKAESVVKRIEK